MRLRLHPHGTYVSPWYQPPNGESEGRAGHSTDEDRRPGVAEVRARFSRHQCASPEALAGGRIKAVYKDAIEYRQVTSEGAGIAFFFGLFICLMLTGFLAFVLGYGIYIGKYTRAAIYTSFLMPFQAVAIYQLTQGIRAVYCQPSDRPIIFDRTNRKVYRIFQERPPGILGMFKPWPLRATEYRWDLVDAEHQAQQQVSNAGMMRADWLMFLVRKSEHDSTIIDTFTLADSINMRGDIAAGTYEHIRRFMEDRGPHLPRPHEPLAQYVDEKIGWWQAQAGPWCLVGPNYFRRWRESPISTAVLHVPFFITIPMGLIAGTGDWIARNTAHSVEWPQEVLDAIGAPLRTGGGFESELARYSP